MYSLLFALQGALADELDVWLRKQRMIIFRKRAGNLSAVTLGRFVARAQRAAGLVGSINVLVTSSIEMRALNKRFRGKDSPTDVLSFPSASPAAGDPIVGEIAISREIAAKNARILGHTTAEEIKILVLHGILHLRGYDHENDDGEMGRCERRLRARLRLPGGLIGRAVSRDGRNSGAAASRQGALVARGGRKGSQ